MPDIICKLRYFPVGDVAGQAERIKKSELDATAKKYNVSIFLDEVKGKTAETQGDKLKEETMNSTIEEVTQSAVTVKSEDERAVRGAIKELIKKYRAPRTVFGTIGSNEKGKLIIDEICDVEDGWR